VLESAHPPASRLLEALALLEESAAGLMAQARPDMAAVAGARQQAVAVRCARTGSAHSTSGNTCVAQVAGRT